jgi:hypothetical protein
VSVYVMRTCKILWSMAWVILVGLAPCRADFATPFVGINNKVGDVGMTHGYVVIEGPARFLVIVITDSMNHVVLRATAEKGVVKDSVLGREVRIKASVAKAKTPGANPELKILAVEELKCKARPLEIECGIRNGATRFKVGEPVEIAIVIRNRSAVPVNASFWMRQKERPIVTFRGRGPEGKRFLLSTKKAPWCGTGVPNVAIPAGREFRFTVDLLKTWEWWGAETKLPPGDYEISAEMNRSTTQGARPIVAASGSVAFTIDAGE